MFQEESPSEGLTPDGPRGRGGNAGGAHRDSCGGAGLAAAFGQRSGSKGPSASPAAPRARASAPTCTWGLREERESPMSTKRGRGNRGRQDDGEGAHGHIPRPRSLPGLKNGHGRNKIQRVGRKHTKMVSISVSLSTPHPSVNDLEENVKRIRAGLGTESWALAGSSAGWHRWRQRRPHSGAFKSLPASTTSGLPCHLCPQCHTKP